MARKFQDMSRSRKEKLDSFMPKPSDGPDYPFGLSICLGDKELEKLGLEDLETGELLDLRCMAMITSINKTMVNDEPQCRVELQITHMSAENEDDEEEPKRVVNKRPYF